MIVAFQFDLMHDLITCKVKVKSIVFLGSFSPLLPQGSTLFQDMTRDWPSYIFLEKREKCPRAVHVLVLPVLYTLPTSCTYCLPKVRFYSKIYVFLTEKRAKYDSGEDPLDPEAQQGGGNPWQHGGFPFGEGFQFKFHFN